MRPVAPLLALIALAGSGHALELGKPEVHFERNCSVTVTLRLMPDPGQDPKQISLDIAAPPTHRKLGHAYPTWASTAQLNRFDRDGAHHVDISSAEALPTHPSTLVLALDQGAKTLTLHTVEVPACNRSGNSLDVEHRNTLFGIALPHSRAMDVDIDRLMLAIQLYNREAFIYDNINLLRTGPRLYIPSHAEIARLSLTREWVAEEIRHQNERWELWKAGRDHLGASTRLEERHLRIVPVNLTAQVGVVEPLRPASEPETPTETQPEMPATPEDTALKDPVPPQSRLSGLLEPWVLWVVGGLLLAWLTLFAVRRLLQAREVRRTLGDIPERAARATSALDLAHAHVEASEHARARPLLRLVISDGTEEERAEAKNLQDQIH